MVNLSDLAAVSANQAWLSLALTLPSVDYGWLVAFSDSLFQQLGYYDMQLIGGDTTRSPLSLTFTIQGRVSASRAADPQRRPYQRLDLCHRHAGG